MRTLFPETRWERALALAALLLHLWLWGAAVWNHSALVEDGVQYLTISENMLSGHGFSQSLEAPFIPDLQRTPGYPAFLCMLGTWVPLVLLVQHLLLFAGAWALYRGLRLYVTEPAARLTAWLWLLMPYPALMASLILSESLFLTFLSFFLWQMAAFLHGKCGPGRPLFALGIAVLIRPVAFPLLLLLLPVLAVITLRRRPLRLIAVANLVLIPLLLLGPWMYRSHKLSGEWALSNMGRMGMLHGRLGGLETWQQGRLEQGEHALFMAGDSIAALELGLPALRAYPAGGYNHETEAYHPRVSGITWEYYTAHPAEALQFQALSLWQMLKGVGYGWAGLVTQNRWAALLLAGVQMLMNVLLAMAILLGLLRLRQVPGLLWLGLILAAVVLFVSAAAWADGRYRIPADLLLWPFVALLCSRFLPATTEKA